MQIDVIRDDSTIVRETIEQYHYLHRYPDPRSLPFSYVLQVDGERYAPDGRLNGVLTFKKAQHHKQRGLFGYDGLPTAWQVLDLARVYVHPNWQRHENGHALCMFSRMVSRVLKRVQQDWLEHHPPRFPQRPYHIELIISYCQLEHHDGTAYRASNFTSAGLTNDSTKEVYYRQLKAPRWKWSIENAPQPVQLPLLDVVGLKYF